MGLSYWDGAYRSDRKIWGKRPSEFALAAAKYFSEAGIPTAGFRMLDIGCGYGRDALFLASRLGVRMTAVDPAAAAVEMARADASKGEPPSVDFRVSRFQDVADGPFDVVYAANLYQILPPEERRLFPGMVNRLLAPDGSFILGTLSSRDPEHAGKRTAIPGDINSRVDEKYVHLSDRAELEAAFHFLKFQQFYEHEYLESRAGGARHHHISWILIGSRIAAESKGIS
jgi:cyclopropane fatty-acyl-phospholipid synthase-like methyltransferase